MGERKISGLMVLFSALGGVVGFVIGELLLSQLEGNISPILLIALYYGQFALVVGFFIFLAELISPDLNGIGWRTRYTGQGWLWLVPATFVMLFAAGALFQFVYGLDLNKQGRARNMIMVMDVSGSMNETDPKRESIQAAKELIQRMDKDMKVAVITFNENTNILQPLVPLNNQAAKDSVIAALDNFGDFDGQTDIGLALNQAVEQIGLETDASRKSVVILVSDGYSEVNLSTTLAPFLKDQIAIHSIGMNSPQGSALLEEISNRTHGSFYEVEKAQRLSEVYDQIYKEQQQRHLVGERPGEEQASVAYAALRILFIALIGSLLGLSLGIIFDNRHLALSFGIGGLIAGLLAGLILEFGLRSSLLPNWSDRLFADLVLAVLLSISSLIIPIKGKYVLNEPARNLGGRALQADPYRPKSSKGFR